MKTEYIFKYGSPIGVLTILSDGNNITGLGIKNVPYSKDAKTIEVDAQDIPVFIEIREWMDAYFCGRKPDCMPLIKTEGTGFQQAVWQLLLQIPYGKVVTYGEIAAQIARQSGKKRMSAQAVGGAVGKNPVSILVPCHRVVGAGGNLTGYGSGLDIKVYLLELEGLDMTGFHMPSKKTD